MECSGVSRGSLSRQPWIVAAADDGEEEEEEGGEKRRESVGWEMRCCEHFHSCVCVFVYGWVVCGAKQELKKGIMMNEMKEFFT